MRAVVECIAKLGLAATRLDLGVIDIAVDEHADRTADRATSKCLGTPSRVHLGDFFSIDSEAELTGHSAEAGCQRGPRLHRQGTESWGHQDDIGASAIGVHHEGKAVGGDAKPVGVLIRLDFAGDNRCGRGGGAVQIDLGGKLPIREGQPQTRRNLNQTVGGTGHMQGTSE